MKLVRKRIFELLSASIIFCTPYSAKAINEINSIDIVEATITAVNCLEYCLTGTCTWFRCSGFPPSCSVVVVPKVRHYTPELVVSSYTETGNSGFEGNPWTEIRAVTGSMNEAITNGIIASLLGTFDAGGHRAEDSKRRDHRQMIFKEVEIFGHPLASVINILAGGSPFPVVSSLGNFNGVNDPGTPSGTGGGSTPAPADWDIPGAASMASDMAPILASVTGTLELMSMVNDFQNAMDTINTLSSGFDLISGSGSSGPLTLAMNSGQYFCPTNATSYIPYYLSSFDWVAWRWGVPDIIQPASWVPGMREITDGTTGAAATLLPLSPFNTWGNVMPRTGFVTQYHETKAAAVVSQRSADIVTRIGQPHVYFPLTDPSGNGLWPPGPVTENDTKFKWQMLVPHTKSSCEVFGANDAGLGAEWGDFETNPNGKYAFTLWRQYECCTDRGGVLLGTVDIEICIF